MADRSAFVKVYGRIIEAVQQRWDLLDSSDNPIPPNERERPYYLYGHHTDISSILMEKDEPSGGYAWRKYPLIILLQDFRENPGGEDYYYDLNFTSFILAGTEPVWHAEERYNNVIIPTLYPIYDILLDEINNSRDLLTVSENQIRPEKIDRPYWGAEGIYGNEGLIYPDVVDGIQLNFTSIKVNFNDCLIA